MTHIEKRAGREMTIKGRDASGGVVTEKVTLGPRRYAWYEHAGAELMALDLGVVIGGVTSHWLGWQQVALIGAVGFVIAVCGVWGVGTWYRVRFEKIRSITMQRTLARKAKGAAPMTSQHVPPEHKRDR